MPADLGFDDGLAEIEPLLESSVSALAWGGKEVRKALQVASFIDVRLSAL